MSSTATAMPAASVCTACAVSAPVPASREEARGDVCVIILQNCCPFMNSFVPLPWLLCQDVFPSCLLFQPYRAIAEAALLCFWGRQGEPPSSCSFHGGGKTRGQRTLPSEIIAFYRRLYDCCWADKTRFDVPHILSAPTSSSFGATLSRVAGSEMFHPRYADMPILSRRLSYNHFPKSCLVPPKIGEWRLFS